MDKIGMTELRDKIADVVDEVRYNRKTYAVTRFGKVVAYFIPVADTEAASVGFLEGPGIITRWQGDVTEDGTKVLPDGTPVGTARPDLVGPPRVLTVHEDGSVSGGEEVGDDDAPGRP